MAVGSLALAILSLFVCPLAAFPGAIMGFVELARIKRGESPREGHGLALAGAILGVVVIGFIILILVTMFVFGIWMATQYP